MGVPELCRKTVAVVKPGVDRLLQVARRSHHTRMVLLTRVVGVEMPVHHRTRALFRARRSFTHPTAAALVEEAKASKEISTLPFGGLRAVIPRLTLAETALEEVNPGSTISQASLVHYLSLISNEARCRTSLEIFRVMAAINAIIGHCRSLGLVEEHMPRTGTSTRFRPSTEEGAITLELATCLNVSGHLVWIWIIQCSNSMICVTILLRCINRLNSFEA